MRGEIVPGVGGVAVVRLIAFMGTSGTTSPSVRIAQLKREIEQQTTTTTSPISPPS